MCTALHCHGLFGRTLDLEYSYAEQVVILPRRFPFSFRRQTTIANHYAMVGMAHVAQNRPLFYDAVNEAGLAMAALNFPHSAVYLPPRQGAVNLAPFELMDWVLGQCATAAHARQLLAQVNVEQADFSPDLPSTPLHWMVADQTECFVAEPTADGLRLYANPIGALTNEPPFPIQLTQLNSYLSLSSAPPVNRFAPHLSLVPHSRGMGALGLPGDWSSPSRFVRAAFAAHNSSGAVDVTQFFHLMACVEVPRGCVRLGDGREVTSIYTSCCDLERGIYHYVTYENRQISAVSLRKCDLDGDILSCFPLVTQPQIHRQN